jgi:hypothetical protein
MHQHIILFVLENWKMYFLSVLFGKNILIKLRLCNRYRKLELVLKLKHVTVPLRTFLILSNQSNPDIQYIPIKHTSIIIVLLERMHHALFLQLMVQTV